MARPVRRVAEAGAPTAGLVRVAAVAIGGAVGASLRAGLDVALSTDGWASATLAVNLVGTFALAVLSRRLGTSTWAVAVTVGLLGAFTTFSALVVEVVILADRPAMMLVYVAASLVGGAIAATLGLRLGGRGR